MIVDPKSTIHWTKIHEIKNYIGTQMTDPSVCIAIEQNNINLCKLRSVPGQPVFIVSALIAWPNLGFCILVRVCLSNHKIFRHCYRLLTLAKCERAWYTRYWTVFEACRLLSLGK